MSFRNFWNLQALDIIINVLRRITPERVVSFISGLFHHRSIQSLHRWWKSQKQFYRHLTVNLVIGIFIAIVLHSFDTLPFLRQAEDEAFDWVMSMERGKAPVRSVMPFAFLDIDEAAYRNWEEPFHIPRDKLLDIIQFSVSGNPALIVVDVDLSKQGQCPEHDLALANFLKDYHGRGKPPIILPQLFREAIGLETARTLRESFITPLPGNSIKDPRVFLASPLFELDDSDLRLRRWRLWEPDKPASSDEVVPSVEMLAVALFNQPYRDPAFVFQDLKQKIMELSPVEKVPESEQPKKSMTVNIADLTFKGDTEDIGQRIIFSIPWNLRKGQTYPDNFVKRPVLPITQNAPPALEQNPADPYTRQSQCSIPFTRSGNVTGVAQQDKSWLEGRVVVIGASFGDSRDIYATPIGPMPGAMVIVNAMNSLHEHGQIEKPGLFWTIVIESFLIFVMSIAFLFFDGFLGMLLSSAAIILTILPLSFYLFKYGVWLDFAIPLIAVKLHRMHASFEENKTIAQEHPDHDAR